MSAAAMPPVKRARGTGWSPLLNGAATLQLVWFYLAYVHCYVDMGQYERGRAHTPFQYRLLLMLPLRWAHASAVCNRVAAALTSLHAWFPTGVRPESLVEVPVDVAAIAVAGLVARRLYRAASNTGLLEAAVYPLTLVLVAATYAMGTMYRLRFVYDLPSLGFFAAGMLLLYLRRPIWQFALLFAVATLNRETTLFLLVMFVLARGRRSRPPWLPWRDVVVAGALLAAWCAWHVWVVHHFAANGSDGWNRLWLNAKVLLLPVSWLQLMSCFAFCGPLLVRWRHHVHDPVLRRWLWIVPLWAAFMLRYGLLLESRVFGELIPLVSCCFALGAEVVLLRRLQAVPRFAQAV